MTVILLLRKAQVHSCNTSLCLFPLAKRRRKSLDEGKKILEIVGSGLLLVRSIHEHGRQMPCFHSFLLISSSGVLGRHALHLHPHSPWVELLEHICAKGKLCMEMGFQKKVIGLRTPNLYVSMRGMHGNTTYFPRKNLFSHLKTSANSYVFRDPAMHENRFVYLAYVHSTRTFPSERRRRRVPSFLPYAAPTQGSPRVSSLWSSNK